MRSERVMEEVHVQPMRRRHLRSVLRIEQQVYPRPWSSSLFMSELALQATRAYYVARVGRDLVHEQEHAHGQATNLAKLGVRQQVAKDLILTADAGAGLGEDTPDFRLLVGIRRSFTLF